MKGKEEVRPKGIGHSGAFAEGKEGIVRSRQADGVAIGKEAPLEAPGEVEDERFLAQAEGAVFGPGIVSPVAGIEDDMAQGGR